MKVVFADTLYWLAIVRPNDPWKKAASEAKARLGKYRVITTDEVLVEFLASLAGGGQAIRKKAAQMVKTILDNPNVEVIPQTRGSFLDGLSLYEERPDKQYSLTDCISIKVMKSRSVQEALTNDHHFEQEGLTVLIKRDQ